MQVAEHHTAGVQFGHRLLDLAEHPLRPLGVPGQVAVRSTGVGQRVAGHEQPLQRVAVDELLHQEVVVADHEVVEHGRHDVEPGQPRQHVPLQGEARHGVPTGAVEPGVRPGLLQHHPLLGPAVPPEVHTAAVGELQHRLDGVGQVVDPDAVAGGEVRFEEPGQREPRRQGERRAADIGHQPAGVVLEREHPLAVVGDAEALGEAAVPHVERAVAVAQVAQHVGPADTAQRDVQLGERALERGLVGRVDRHQLAAGTAERGLRVEHEHHGAAAEELEREPSRHAVLPHGVDDALGVVEARRDVDLPALGGQIELGWGVVVPGVARIVGPAIGHLAEPEPLVGRRGGHPVGAVVEHRIGEAEHFVLIGHRRSPLGRLPGRHRDRKMVRKRRVAA